MKQITPDASTVADDPALLDQMIRWSEQQSDLWRPTSYWRGYCQRITDELEREGLSNFRQNQGILKGFAAGGVARRDLPRARWKRLVWRGVEQLPVVRRIISEYARLLSAENQHHQATRVRLAHMLLDELAKDFPDLAPVNGLANGGAADAFEWRGHTVSADWLPYLARAAAFYRLVPAGEITSLIEIGPGLGFSSLAHLAINPHLKLIVNVDIPPVLYVSTQFLKSIPDIDVIDARQAGDGEIALRPGADSPSVYQLAPWQLPKIRGRLDAFFNAYSFQEMEKEICTNYARQLIPIIGKTVMLLSAPSGHRPGAGGQKAPISLDFLTGLFSNEFAHRLPVRDRALELFVEPAEVALLSRSERVEPSANDRAAPQTAPAGA